MQFGRGDMAERCDEFSKRLEMRIASKLCVLREGPVDQGYRPAHIPDFMGDRAGNDSVIVQKVAQVLFLALAHLFGNVHRNGCQSATSWRLIGREPDLCHKQLPGGSGAWTLRPSPDASRTGVHLHRIGPNRYA